jgi:mevalonate kinase
MSFDFSTTTHGKWILAGEHAVLRGVDAIVFPLQQYTMQFNYQANPNCYETQFSGTGENWHTLIRSVLEKAYALIDRSAHTLTGHFSVHNEIPLSVGLGGSAALCVATARWIHWQGAIAAHELLEFARQLENLFHRDSSGVDIAGANADGGLIYNRNGHTEALTPSWHPQWYLSNSQQIGVTAAAVSQVETLQAQQPSTATAIDNAMQQAVTQAKAALQTPEPNGITELLKAINQAKVCFTRWGFTDKKVTAHMQCLTDAGAIACKPTGSGNGGYVLSLWTEAPNIDIELIRV